MRLGRKMPQDIPWRTWSDLLFTQRADVHVCSSLGPEGWHRVAELRIVRPEQTGPLRPWPKLLVRLEGEERWWPAADLHVRRR